MYMTLYDTYMHMTSCFGFSEWIFKDFTDSGSKEKKQLTTPRRGQFFLLKKDY